MTGRATKGSVKGGSRDKFKKRAFRVLKVLEIGAGGAAIGEKAGEFTRRLGSTAQHRREVLRYANRRPVRGNGEAFRSVAAMASDSERNPANDFRLDAEQTFVRGCSVHIVLAIGPRQYGFADRSSTERFLKEMSRILHPQGELIVIGRFVNPWFNPGIGARYPRRTVGVVARDVGLRVANFLTPLGRHPMASLFRIRGKRFVQYSSQGRRLGEPSYFHRFVKQYACARRRRRSAR